MTQINSTAGSSFSLTYGTVTVTNGRQITYQAYTNVHGQVEQFTYTIDDGHSHTATGNVTVNVL